MKNWIKQKLSFKNKSIAYLLCTCFCCPVSGWGMQANTALIIIDVQNDYFSGGKFELAGSVEASLQARKVLAYFRQNNLPIIHIQHESADEIPTVFAPNSDGQKIHENVQPMSGEAVFTKHQVSSFEQTPLLAHLKEKKIGHLVIAGMQTNVCVQGTVKDAIKHGFEVVVVTDAAAARELKIHDDTLIAIQADGAELTTVEALITK